MIPIAYNNDKVFGDEDKFKDYLLKTCADHHASGRALAFAFIVYDYKNPQISKILKDHDYWNALHDLSGQYLSVFYFEKPVTKKPVYRPDISNNTFQYMTSCGPFSTPQTVNDFIKNTFKIQNDFREPYVIFFQTAEYTITNSFLVKLKNEYIEKAFLELKTHINNAVSSIENVLPENKNNYESIHFLIENAVKQGQFLTFVKGKIYEPISLATTIGSFIKFFI
ncbi:MAG: hypothetical protein FD168_739 [Desulfobulbaceae bacterium]|nr:MAG: hypothetical protein FD168_739 [Desulfobulbaceae bacterium]